MLALSSFHSTAGSWARGGTLRGAVDFATFQDTASHVLARIHALHINFVICFGQPADVNREITALTPVTLFSLLNSLTIARPRLRPVWDSQAQA